MQDHKKMTPYLKTLGKFGHQKIPQVGFYLC